MMKLPCVLVADDAFALSENIMKPYATDLNKGSPKRVFNYRLSRARRIIENTFGLLSAVFRIFRKPIECFDNEDSNTGEIIPGSWREITSGDTGLRQFRSIPRKPASNATNIREEFKSYFMSEIGSLPFQDKYFGGARHLKLMGKETAQKKVGKRKSLWCTLGYRTLNSLFLVVAEEAASYRSSSYRT
eukprot:XP_016656827.1 PREDICTED: uncharacterized protein LOC103308147 [Acyrthosiphon pisum]